MNFNLNDIEVLITIGTSIIGLLNWYLSHKLSLLHKRIDILEDDNKKLQKYDEYFFNLLGELKELKGSLNTLLKISSDKNK